jgi:hypothetical protein
LSILLTDLLIEGHVTQAATVDRTVDDPMSVASGVTAGKVGRVMSAAAARSLPVHSRGSTARQLQK